MKQVLFFVNSLGNGGAERVCSNLEKKYLKEGYEVNYVILFDNITYQHNQKRENVLSLHINPKQSKLKILREIFNKRREVNSFIRAKEQNGKYVLITAHLPLSHICAYLSIIGNRCLYVQHLSLISEGKYYRLYKQFYKRKVNVCVSEGLHNEFVTSMKYNSKNVTTIYNPINIKLIKSTIHNLTEIPLKPYFLCVGRLTKQKRFDRAIEIFYKGEFYKKYNLVILGSGELENDLKSRIKLLGLEDRVHLLGWKQDIYSWMHNAEILLQTSEREALSMVLIEALASGTRVVASYCEYGAHEILRDELSMYIAKQDNINDYIDKINKALESYPLSNHYRILDMCDDTVVCNKYLDIYKKYFGKE